ncbi:hypothetical protein CHUAL_011199 [Chamberlinius hualienensis]
MGRNNGDYCAAINCSNSRTKKPDLSFFRFPKETERCKKWISNCQRISWHTITSETVTNSLTSDVSTTKPVSVFRDSNVQTQQHISCFNVKSALGSLNQDVQTAADVSSELRQSSLLKPISSIHEIISPAIRFHSVSNNIRTIKQLRRLLRQKRQTIYRLKSKLTKAERQENGNEKLLKRRILQIFENIKDEVDINLYYFLKAQLIRKVMNKRKNWTDEELTLPLAVYKTSRNAYRLLSKTLALPSTRTLQRYLTRKTDDILTDLLDSNISKTNGSQEETTLDPVVA